MLESFAYESEAEQAQYSLEYRTIDRMSSRKMVLRKLYRLENKNDKCEKHILRLYIRYSNAI